MKTDKRGFTLIELIVVIIIVGILAAIAVPMMASMRAKAICTEAVTTMGVIRNAFRAHSLEYPDSVDLWCAALLFESTVTLGRIGMTTGDLQGVYFDGGSYYVYYGSTAGVVGTIQCVVPSDYRTAPKADETLSILDDRDGWGMLAMDIATGRITQNGISRSGYPHFEE